MTVDKSILNTPIPQLKPKTRDKYRKKEERKLSEILLKYESTMLDVKQFRSYETETVLEETERKSKLGSTTHQENQKVNKMHTSQTEGGSAQPRPTDKMKSPWRENFAKDKVMAALQEARSQFCHLQIVLRNIEFVEIDLLRLDQNLRIIRGIKHP